MAEHDLYRILGVKPSATLGEIRRAFQKCARHCHPDVNPGDPIAAARYGELSEAFEVLSDARRRAAYDRGERSVTATARIASLDFQGFDFAPGRRVEDLGVREILGSVFAQSESSRPTPGEDLELSTRLSFAEAFRGATRRMQVTRQDHCPSCGGSGDVQVPAEPCKECEGRGRVQVRRGAMVFGRLCSQCGGEGTVRRRHCGRCEGEGRLARSEWLELRIPAGVEHGSRVTLSAGGNVGRRGGATGDLVLVVEVEDHPIYRREGADLTCGLPLSAAEAAVGGHVEAPTPEGPMMVEVAPGTQPLQRLRLRGRGMPRPGGKGRGDLWLETQVVVPRVDDKRGRELLAELMDLYPERPRDGLVERARLSSAARGEGSEDA